MQNPSVKEFRKSVKIRQSYHDKFDAPFFGTQCKMRPLLEYSIQALSPSLRKDINCLEQAQRRVMKLVVEMKKLEYTDCQDELLDT